MRARLASLACFSLALSTLSGCAAALPGHMPPAGGIYAGHKGINPQTQVEISEEPRPGPKTGQACAMGVLGVASWGDMSLDAAKKAGGISRVDTLDFQVMDILGVVYQKHCTVITGE